jgi:hypothetical protein
MTASPPHGSGLQSLELVTSSGDAEGPQRCQLRRHITSAVRLPPFLGAERPSDGVEDAATYRLPDSAHPEYRVMPVNGQDAVRLSRASEGDLEQRTAGRMLEDRPSRWRRQPLSSKQAATAQWGTLPEPGARDADDATCPCGIKSLTPVSSREMRRSAQIGTQPHKLVNPLHAVLR